MNSFGLFIFVALVACVSYSTAAPLLNGLNVASKNKGNLGVNALGSNNSQSYNGGGGNNSNCCNSGKSCGCGTSGTGTSGTGTSGTGTSGTGTSGTGTSGTGTTGTGSTGLVDGLLDGLLGEGTLDDVNVLSQNEGNLGVNVLGDGNSQAYNPNGGANGSGGNSGCGKSCNSGKSCCCKNNK